MNSRSKNLAIAALLVADALTVAAAQAQPPASDAEARQRSPRYQVQIDTAGCAYELRLNDVPLFEEHTGLPVALSIPADPWLRGGLNRLSMAVAPARIDPAFFDEAKCRVALYRRHPGARGPGELVAELVETPPLPTPEAAAHFETLDTLSRHFEVDEPRPAWAWTDSEPISDDAATRQALIAHYQTIWKALAEQRVADILPLFAERSRELAQALNRPADDMLVRLANLQSATNDPALRLHPLKPEQVELVVFGEGRLAKLTRGDGHPLIAFNGPDGHGSFAFDVIFRKSGDRWIITR